MKVSELEGVLLDNWAAKAEQQQGGEWYREGDGTTWVRKGDHTVFRPSRLWECGGPIIEREIAFLTRHCPTKWSALANGSAPGHGPTPLVAAMRAYVASKFGDEVPQEAQ